VAPSPRRARRSGCGVFLGDHGEVLDPAGEEGQARRDPFAALGGAPDLPDHVALGGAIDGGGEVQAAHRAVDDRVGEVAPEAAVEEAADALGTEGVVVGTGLVGDRLEGGVPCALGVEAGGLIGAVEAEGGVAGREVEGGGHCLVSFGLRRRP